MCYLEVGDKSVFIVGRGNTGYKDRHLVLGTLMFDTQGKKLERAGNRKNVYE